MSGVPSLPADIDRTDAQKPRFGNTEGILQDVAIENFRPYKVIVIGAGFSGINCAIRIPERLRNVELTVYEKNNDVGGTWLENRYPGCACDVPGKSISKRDSCCPGNRNDTGSHANTAHSYQYSYAPNPNWSGFYAPSEEIHDYLKEVCGRFSASRFIKLNHRVESCKWEASEGRW
jgi:cation diffusion facilitator CzcD-associated flavoprotein CzcO